MSVPVSLNAVCRNSFSDILEKRFGANSLNFASIMIAFMSWLHSYHIFVACSEGYHVYHWVKMTKADASQKLCWYLMLSANFLLVYKVVDYLIDPFVAGTTAGDPESLSVSNAFISMGWTFCCNALMMKTFGYNNITEILTIGKPCKILYETFLISCGALSTWPNIWLWPTCAASKLCISWVLLSGSSN